MRRIFLLLPLLSALQASEVRVDELRLNYMPVLGDAVRLHGTVTVDDDRHDISGTGGLQYHQRVGLGYYRSLYGLEDGKGSFEWGCEAAYERLGDEHKRARGAVVDVFAGWAWAFTPRWHIEHGLLLGGGVHRWRVDGQVDQVNDTALAYEYGIRLGTYYTWASGWQAGVDGRYTAMRANVHSQTTGLDYDAEMQIDGFGLTLCLGHRF